MTRTITALLLLAASALAQPTAPLDAAGLTVLTRQLLLDNVRHDAAGADVRVEVDPIDARLRFPACDDLKLAQHGRAFGRTSVTLRCDAPQPWVASMTATIGVWRKVAVVVHALASQTVVQANDIEMQRRDLAELNGQYIDSPERVVGFTTRRAIAPGTVVGVRQLIAPVTVNKGDDVKIRAGQGPVAVSMTGTALGAGMTGEQIAVRNVQSSRIVKVWVLGPGLVSTAPPAP